MNAPTLPPPADDPVLVPEASPPACCPNCGAERVGAYCPACGQHQLGGRLTLRRLWAEFASRVFNLDRGLLATFVGLTKRPGLVPLDYVEGRRRRYTNPLSYLLLASAFSLFMLQFSEDVLREQLQNQLASQYAASEAGAEAPTGVPHDHDGDGVVDHAMDPARERLSERLDALRANPAEFYELLTEGMTRFNAILTVFLCLPLALLLRLFFGPVRNVAEAGVFALYVVGHATILASLASAGLIRLGQAAPMLGVLVYVGLAAWGAMQFWRGGLGAAARAAGAMVIAYGVYFVLVMAVTLVYVFNAIMAEAGYSWGALLRAL